jgi:hypothetical protein
VSKEEALQKVKEERNILHRVKRRKANGIGHIVAQELPSKLRYCWIDRGKDRSDVKTRKKS